MIVTLLLLSAEAPSSLMQDYNEALYLRHICEDKVLEESHARELPLPDFVVLLDGHCGKERSAQRQRAIALLAERGVPATAAEKQVDDAEAEIRRVRIATYKPKVAKLRGALPPTPLPPLPPPPRKTNRP